MTTYRLHTADIMNLLVFRKDNFDKVYSNFKAYLSKKEPSGNNRCCLYVEKPGVAVCPLTGHYCNAMAIFSGGEERGCDKLQTDIKILSDGLLQQNLILWTEMGSC